MGESSSQRDSLDELLAAARWPEADGERLARLQRHWASQLVSARRPLWRVALRCAAVAAAVLIAVGAVWWSTRDRQGQRLPDNRPDVARPEDDRSPGRDDAAPTYAKNDEPRPTPRHGAPEVRRVEKPVVATATIGRAATPLEEVLFKAWQARRRTVAWQQDAAVEAAIEAIRYDATGDEASAHAKVAAAARPLFARRAYCERRLIENARYFDGSRRAAALALLGEVGTARAAGELLPLLDVERDRSAAVATLLKLAAPEKIALAARRQRDPAARRRWLLALAVAGDVRSVGALLTCVADDATRQAALDVVAEIRPLPTAAMLAWLDSPDAARRAAAAAVLAVATDPAAIEQVVSLARRGELPPAAWVALVGSQQPAAREFVAEARQTQFIAAIHEAQYQWRALRQAAL